jgi:hypothetical protein
MAKAVIIFGAPLPVLLVVPGSNTVAQVGPWHPYFVWRYTNLKLLMVTYFWPVGHTSCHNSGTIANRGEDMISSLNRIPPEVRHVSIASLVSVPVHVPELRNSQSATRLRWRREKAAQRRTSSQDGFFDDETVHIPEPRPTVCTEDDCDNKHKARGLCEKHYKRGRRAAGMMN